jgi:hypothetical protein
MDHLPESERVVFKTTQQEQEMISIDRRDLYDIARPLGGSEITGLPSGVNCEEC